MTDASYVTHRTGENSSRLSQDAYAHLISVRCVLWREYDIGGAEEAQLIDPMGYVVMGPFMWTAHLERIVPRGRIIMCFLEAHLYAPRAGGIAICNEARALFVEIMDELSEGGLVRLQTPPRVAAGRTLFQRIVTQLMQGHTWRSLWESLLGIEWSEEHTD